MTAPVSPLYLTPAKAGELMGCSGETVRKMIRRGELKGIRHGRAFKVPRIEVEKLTSRKLGGDEEERERQAKLKELRVTLARAQQLLAELE